MISLSTSQLPSVAIFGPQSKTPTPKYLAELSSYIRSKEVFAPLVEAIKDLPGIWETFLKLHDGIAKLDDGPRYMLSMSNWITGEVPMAWGDDVPSGMLAFPMLTIIHLAQYFQYLDEKGLTHHELLKEFQTGAGIQGYCGGMLSAISVACANTEEEIIAIACNAIRVAVGVGAAADVMDDNPEKLSCIMVIRLKYDGQGEEIVKKFPGTHISAINDFKTLSVTGSAQFLLELEKYALSQKLTVSMIPLRGKMHNPENAQLARYFADFCAKEEKLQMPDARAFLVRFRSNLTTEVMTQGSLTLEVARTILADKCFWYQLLVEVSKDLTQTKRTEHSLAAFGIGDCVSLEPFRKAGIKMTKLNIFSLLSSRVSTSATEPPKFSPDAIAVVGLAGRFPGANNVEELWELISAGKSMAQEQPKERVNFEGSHRVKSDSRWASKQKFYGNFISDHDCFDHSFFRISGKEAMYMDPQQRLLLETAYQAIESSGYLSSSDGDRVGVFIGASFTDYLEHTTASTPNAYIATGNIRAFLSGKISHQFGWTGPSEVIDTACSSSLVAISRGCRAIQRKECTTALVGGVNFMSTPTHTLDLGRASFLSPTGQCKPFDASADGYCRSEGVGLLVLKPLSEAMANNDHIFGVIPGISTNQGSDARSITVPSSTAHLQLYRDILKESSIDPSLITYVEAHGTGTQVGDPIEMDGIRKGFAGPDRAYPINLGSIKANIGHCECAAGVAGVIKAILMVNKGIIPPVANFKRLNPKIPAIEPDKIVIPTSVQPWNAPYRAVIVNSYGAAGSNAALLMCQSPQKLDLVSSGRVTSSFPIILTAGSKKSLTMYANALKKHLQSPAGSNKTIGDISFTLSKTRKPHKFAWTTTTDDIQSLSGTLEDLSSIVELPEDPKNIVLAFSGQVKQFVGLDKALYDACPLLQKHLEVCDKYLTSTGSPSIFPDIFQTEAFSDVVLLQCCMFALQYSFAKSWIDCGLKVAAVVGHSFGELTAMAVSCTLSLESTIDIIRTRATLIETKWGPDRGSMLVIHSTESVVNDVLSYLPEDAGKAEIACYNSKTSHVVVGSSSAISSVQQILKDVSKFSTLRSSKPDTSHGFHSFLTEELLPDLDEAARKHTFSSPAIPLEACTLEQSISTSHERISQHFRQPVFFHHAVARIEKRLGPCMWLEAGVDTPVIPMLQRAVDSRQNHVFIPVKLTRGQEPMAAISEVTTKLWRESVHVSFFNFETPGLNRVWLPPYAFERNPAWLPYVDPTAEALKNIEQSAPAALPQPAVESAPQRLVNPTNSTKQFSIGTKTDRFKSIVAGHNVIGNPLCPAALYLESAIMAAQYSLGSLENSGYKFWDFRIDSPLGIDHRREVLLDIEGNSRNQDWSFVLKSSLAGQVKTTLHAKAGFKFFTSQSSQDVSQFQYYQRFVKARLAGFSTNTKPEIFKMNRAYRLFSRVVNYSSILTGMTSIMMAGNEVIAELDLPAASDTEESSAIAACDTIAMDNFVQVVGLLINSSNLCTESEAFLATGAGTITFAPGFNLKTIRKFSVYASFAAEGNSKTSGDIFVLAPDGTLVSVVIGMHFSKLPLSTLRKILEPISQKEGQILKLSTKTTTSDPRPMPATHVPTSQSTQAVPVPTGKKSASTPSQNAMLLTSLKTVVAEFAGVDEAQISTDALISDLGVDSLAAIELIEELQTQFNIDISSTDITSTNISALALLVPNFGSADFGHNPIDDNSSVASASSSLMTASVGASSESSAEDSDFMEQLFALIAEYTAIDANSINEKSDLESLGVDSLSLIELQSALEERYGVEFDFDVSVTVGTLASMLEIDRKQAARPPPPQASSAPSVLQVQMSDAIPKEELFAVIADYAAISSSSITTSASLEDLGIDSLSFIELKSSLEEIYPADLDFDVSTTVSELLSMLGTNADPVPVPLRTQQAQPAKISAPPSSTASSVSMANAIRLRDPIEALQECKTIFNTSAQKYGLTKYCDSAKPKQDQLVLAYIIEAFQELGSDLHTLRYGDAVPTFHYLPKHSFLVTRLWDILTEAKLVEKRGSSYVRSSCALPSQASDVLLGELLAAYPQWAIDNKLLSITGSKLAKCLTGKADAVKLLFGDASNRDLLASFYSDSPLFKPAEDILLKFIDQVVPAGTQAPFRILEVGAGTGATTALLADFLQSYDRTVEYTFTDISSTLVASSKKKFSQYKWMDFRTLDLEKEIPADLLGKYDMVFGTNVVHATADVTRSCTSIKSILNLEGFLVLLELTKNINWFDLVFGLLTGWWGATDGRTHALQTAETWSGYFKNAGFSSFGASGLSTAESLVQQVLVGSIMPSKSNRYSNYKRYNMETVPYKVVDNLQIEADIYYPSQPNPSKTMPIALMLHGGGYMTLSRRAIRPYQTQYLLDNGILPVSLDYRLCPEIGIVEGPLEDMRDALKWTRDSLPLLAKAHGVLLNTEKIIMIGWSTGGHLAMTSSWLSRKSGVEPPQAILSFYGPTDFESEYFTTRQGGEYPERSMSIETIQNALSDKVISNYDGPKVSASEQNLGFLQPGDLRSELVLSLLKDCDGLSLLLNGFGSSKSATREQVQSISPMAQVRSGAYRTPTFIIHGDRDEVVPHTMGVDFIEELKKSGVKAEVAVVPRARHIFDLKLKPGDALWEKYVAPGYEFLFRYL